MTTRIARVLSNVFGVNAAEITETTSQDTLEGWDSLNHIHLVASLESEFRVSFTTDQALAMTSVAAIRAALSEHGVAGD
ncbi:MAG TPA: acyl carrier protein [Kofleriaceae bacterium]|nr:acyl carrier protein [Kofleriaceae bacterium]